MIIHSENARSQLRDFTRPELLNRRGITIARDLAEKYAGLLQANLESILDMIVDVSLNNVEQLSMSEYKLSIFKDDLLQCFKSGKAPGVGNIILSTCLANIFTDKLCGGVGRYCDCGIGGRSPIESALISEFVMSRIGSTLNEALKGLQVDKCETIDIDDEPCVIYASFEVRTRTGSGMIEIMLPGSMIAEYLPDLNGQPRTEHFNNLASAIVCIDAVKGDLNIPFATLRNLKIGDVIDFGNQKTVLELNGTVLNGSCVARENNEVKQ